MTNRSGPPASFRTALAIGFFAWMAGTGCAMSQDIPPAASAPAVAEAADPGIAPDARGLLQRPDFVRTGAGETSIHVRVVSFCGHVHEKDNPWRFDPLDEAGLARGRNMLESALAKYPRELLAAHLECVHLLRSLQRPAQGEWEDAAGTYGMKTVYTRLYETAGPAGWSRFSEAVFHHELSSILVGQHPEGFDVKAWRAANPPGFKYVHKMEGSPQLATNHLAEGFVCGYGMMNEENDINTYAMWLFTRSDWLLAQAARHPRVQRKVDLLIEFYGQLDPSFTREFFIRRCRPVLSEEDRRKLEALGTALAADASNCKLYGQRARLYNNLEMFPDAIADAETALGIDPEFAYGYFVRGWARSRIGLPEEAAGDFTRAIALDPSWTASYRERAHVYHSLGRNDEAKQDRQTAQAMEAAAKDPP